MTAVRQACVAHAQRGLQRLHAALLQQPPPGVTADFVHKFLTEYNGALVDQLAQLLEHHVGRGPVYQTPGTPLRWRTLHGWLAAYRTLRRQPPSLAQHEALVQHFLVLPDAVVLAGASQDLVGLRQALAWIRPPAEERAGHRFTHLRALIAQAPARPRKTRTGRDAR